MLDISNYIYNNYKVRKNRKQKSEFIDFIKFACISRGIPCNIEEGGIHKNRNIIIGNLNEAELMITAHYDTPAVLPFSNYLAPNSRLSRSFYLAKILICMCLILGVFSTLISFIISDSFIILLLLLFLVTIFGILSIYGKPNPNNSNDNTSGVITLTEIIFGISNIDFNKLVFVLFDNEEKGYLGSQLFKKRNKKLVNSSMMINFDCVSDGDNILIVQNRGVLKNEQFKRDLEEAFVGDNVKNVIFTSSRKSRMCSDQKSYPNGVGIVALKKNKQSVLYLDKIHTKNDINFNENNIVFLRKCTLNLINNFCADKNKELKCIQAY
nr:M28 family peptidase [uncultured Aminipila sp.]